VVSWRKRNKTKWESIESRQLPFTDSSIWPNLSIETAPVASVVEIGEHKESQAKVYKKRMEHCLPLAGIFVCQSTLLAVRLFVCCNLPPRRMCSVFRTSSYKKNWPTGWWLCLLAGWLDLGLPGTRKWSIYANLARKFVAPARRERVACQVELVAIFLLLDAFRVAPPLV